MAYLIASMLSAALRDCAHCPRRADAKLPQRSSRAALPRCSPRWLTINYHELRLLRDEVRFNKIKTVQFRTYSKDLAGFTFPQREWP
jgi:hypothetical protein